MNTKSVYERQLTEVDLIAKNLHSSHLKETGCGEPDAGATWIFGPDIAARNIQDWYTELVKGMIMKLV